MISGMTNSAVFFGSGPVAAKSLELLLRHTTIEAVITKPRALHHKGNVPVIELAESQGIRTLTASNKSDLDRLISGYQFSSRYAILIDFGIIVSQEVIDAFELGIINSHFSLLPHLRGADPITWSIANGDDKTGVSLMLIDTGLDTGKLIASRTLHIDGDETTPSLTDKLIDLSDDLIREYIPRYISGEVASRNQPHPDRATYSRKLTKSDGNIDWTESAESIERKIRAFLEWPQSRARLADIEIIITAAHVVNQDGKPGSYQLKDSKLLVFAGEKALSIDHLKPLGKKEMPIQAFLSGYRSKL